MGVKVQYNPSTGKASYNPATGKVQVVIQPAPGDDCSECTETPLQIDITFSDVVIGDGCGTADLSPTDIDYTYTDILDINKTYRLTQSAVDDCRWELTPNAVGVPIVGGTVTQHTSNNGNCTGFVETTTYTRMNIDVVIIAGTARVFVDFNSDPMYSDFNPGYTPTDGCVGGDSTNEHTNPFETAMWLGTATISEV